MDDQNQPDDVAPVMDDREQSDDIPAVPRPERLLPVIEAAARAKAEVKRIAVDRAQRGRRIGFRRIVPWVLAALCGLVVVLVFTFGAASQTQNGSDTVIPHALLGVWKTSAAKYAGRFLEITENTIVFGTGETTADVHVIARVQAVPFAQGTRYTVSYRSDDAADAAFLTLQFVYNPAAGQVRLVNQDELVWTNTGRRPTVSEMIEDIEASAGNAPTASATETKPSPSRREER